MSEDQFESLNEKADNLIALCAEMKRENQILKADTNSLQNQRRQLLEKNKQAKSKLESILVQLKAMDQSWRLLQLNPGRIIMNEQSSAVQVKILDKEYQVNCPPADQEALMKSAKYLDENMRKIKGRGNIHGAEKIAVMAALNITHDMLKKNHVITEARHTTAQQLKDIEDKIDIALATNRQLEI